MHALWSSARSCETNQVAECQTRQQSAHHRTHTFNRCSSGVLLSSAPPCSHGNTTHGTCLRGPSLSTRKPYSVAPTRYLHRTVAQLHHAAAQHCHAHHRPSLTTYMRSTSGSNPRVFVRYSSTRGNFPSSSNDAVWAAATWAAIGARVAVSTGVPPLVRPDTIPLVLETCTLMSPRRCLKSNHEPPWPQR